MKIKQGINFNIILLLMALLPRLAVLFILPPVPEKILTPLNDPTDYDFLAKEILKGCYDAPGGFPTAFRPPAYPAFMALIYLFAGRGNLLAVAFVQVILDVLNAFILRALALRITGSKTASALSAAAFAIYPAFILQSTQILSEALCRTLFLGFIWALAYGLERKDEKWIIISGILCGASILNKSVLLCTVPLILFWLGACWNGTAREKITSAVIYFTLPLFCVIMPWTLRNYQVSGGEFIPVSTNYPITFAHGVTRFCYYANIWYGRERLMPAPENYQELTQMRAYRGVKEELEVGRRYKSLALRFMKDHPGFIIRMTIRKGLHFWSPLIRNTRIIEFIAFFSMAPVLLLGWIGIVAGLWSGGAARRYATLALAIALPVSLPYILSQPDVRYRVSIIDPLWIIGAAWFLVWLTQKVHPVYSAASSGQCPSSNHDASGQNAGA